MHVIFQAESGKSCNMDTIQVPNCWAKDVFDLKSGLCTTKFRENSSIIVGGRSGSGKTTFVFNLLKNAGLLFEGDRSIKVLYLYKSDQDLFREMEYSIPNIEFHQGMLSQADILSRHNDPSSVHFIIVFDDLMRETGDSADVMDFFSISCHHARCSVILVTHNIFHQGRYSKTLAVNAGYVVLFETPAAMEQIQKFGRQRFPFEKNMLLNIYRTVVCGRRFGYIVLDMNVNVCPYLRIKSSIFPGENTEYFYDSNYVMST